MKTFKLDNNYYIECEFIDKENGFIHEAQLFNNKGIFLFRKQCHYDNRTWEAYEFETVMKKIIDDYFTGTKHEKYITIVKKGF